MLHGAGNSERRGTDSLWLRCHQSVEDRHVLQVLVRQRALRRRRKGRRVRGHEPVDGTFSREPAGFAVRLPPRARQNRVPGDHAMSFDLELTSRRVLVTGGTKGVGAAVVEVLRAAGTQIIATARSVPRQRVEGVRYVAADLSTAEGVNAVAGEMLQRLGGIDILVNVLGGSSAPAGGYAALDDAQWSKELNHNLMPAVRLD